MKHLGETGPGAQIVMFQGKMPVSIREQTTEPVNKMYTVWNWGKITGVFCSFLSLLTLLQFFVNLK